MKVAFEIGCMVGANLNDRKRCEKQSTHDRLKLGSHNNGAGQTLSSRACGVMLTLCVQVACSEPVRQNTIIGAVTAAWRNALVALRAVEGSMGQLLGFNRTFVYFDTSNLARNPFSQNSDLDPR